MKGAMKKRYFYRGKRIHRSSLPAQVLSAFCGVLLILFAVSSVMAVRACLQSRSEQQAFEHLSAVKEAAADASVSSPEAAQQDTRSVYETLRAQIADFSVWLTVPGTDIDYPVMYTPDNPEYYLHRAFDQSDSVSGTPFIGEGGSPESDLFIIYGHNMKNGTMFGTLSRYEDPDFYREHSTLTLASAEGEDVYEIFAAVETRVLYAGEAGYRYYSHAGELSETDFIELTGWLSENTLYSTGVPPSPGKQIAILSTCSYHTENGRFLIAAQKIS